MSTPGLRKRTPEELAEMRRISALQDEVRTATHSACDRISPERSAAILQAVSNGDLEAIARLQDPFELHLVASNWNGDGGTAPLLKIIEHPFCDAGTALWLYWDNDPYFYATFRSVNDAEDDEERSMLKLSRTIEDRFTRGSFASSSIPFDPNYWVNEKSGGAPGTVHEIPAIMTRPVKAP